MSDVSAMQLSSPPVTPRTRRPSSSTNPSPTASSTPTSATSDVTINVKRRGEATAVAIALNRLEKVETNQFARGWFRNFVLRDPETQSIVCGDCVRQVQNGAKVVEKISVWKNIDQRKPIKTHLRLEHRE